MEVRLAARNPQLLDSRRVLTSHGFVEPPHKVHLSCKSCSLRTSDTNRRVCPLDQDLQTSSFISTRDPQTGDPVQVFAASTLKWSSGTNWRDIVVEEHDITVLETPEFEVPDHVLALHLELPSAVDLHIDGRHHSEVHAPGHLTLFPAGVSRRVTILERHGVLLIALSPKLLVQAGLEMREAPAVQLAEQFCFSDPQCEHIACALKAEAESNYPSGALYGETLAMGLAARLRRGYGTANDSASVYKGGMAPQVLRRVLDFIHDNLGDELRMESLAAV